MASKTVHLGFLAVSPTAPAKLRTFPIIAGFDDTGPKRDLQAQLAKDGDWKGYALAIDSKGTFRIKAVKPDKD